MSRHEREGLGVSRHAKIRACLVMSEKAEGSQDMPRLGADGANERRSLAGSILGGTWSQHARDSERRLVPCCTVA